MRIATNSTVNQYLDTINTTSLRKQKENIRLTTGKQMIDLSDDPAAVSTIQYYKDSLQKSDNYLGNVETAINELVNTQGILEQISGSLGSVRDTASQALHSDNAANLPSLAANIRMQLELMVDTANSSYNGMFVLGGTKTSASSLVPTPPEVASTPFEIIKGTPTASNPSGLSVTFKGNNDKRLVNVGNQSTEQVNVEADSVFGSGSIAMFQDVIDLYNKVAYKSDGTMRVINDPISDVGEIRAIQAGVKKMSDAIDTVDQGTASLGSRQVRLMSIQEQVKEEITRKKDMLSSVEDTDVAKAIMNINKDEMALQYALQVGGKMFSRSLLDFLQ